MKNDNEEHPRGTAASSARARDFDDLQNEFAGVDTGRASRFLLPETTREATATKQRTERAEAHTRLQMLLMANEAYAAFYRETMDRIGDAERAAARAMEKAERRQQEAERNLEDLRSRAARLEDGRRVYHEHDGNVRIEDGSIVESDLADTALWPEDAPSYEDYRASKDAADAAATEIDGIRVYQVDVLGAARERMTDQDDPPSQEELEEITSGVESEMPDQVRRELEGPEQTPIQPSAAAKIEILRL